MIETMRQASPPLPMQTFVHKTPEIIELSRACISVSGSVSLELLYRAKPTVIVFRTTKLVELIVRPMLKVKYITLVNLLADRELYPEFYGDHIDELGVARAVQHWLDDGAAYAEVCRELLALREQVARPGACARTAQRILAAVMGTARRAA